MIRKRSAVSIMKGIDPSLVIARDKAPKQSHSFVICAEVFKDKIASPSACNDRQDAGFTLIELLVTMFIFVLALYAASQIFTSFLTQFKQQSKIAETNIEGIIGLELLRLDIEHAGYGLPWTISGTCPSYLEATSTTTCGTDPSTYNDSTSNPPRSILSGNNNCTNSSDYLVIKSHGVARNDASGRFTYVDSSNEVMEWTPSTERISNGDRVIVILPGTTTANKTLVCCTVEGTAKFFTTYNASTTPDSLTDSCFAPATTTDTYIVYGVDKDTDLRMPFNRADYFISTSNPPARCASGTGILEKAVVNQSNGNLTNYLPLLDCVADIQVIFRLDTNADGVIDTTTDDISTLTAQQIRDQLKEVRVYILAHEGQIDRTYTYPNQPITVGENSGGTDYGRTWSTSLLSSTIGSNWQNYRWKVYRIVVKPTNLE